MRVRRAAALAAGVTAGAAASVLLSRALIRRDRRRSDPEASERLATLPPEDLGPLVSHDGTLLAVRGAGDPRARPTLVFAHGFSLDMTTWHYQWTEFSRDHRCILFDHRGHGRSGPAEGGDHSLQAMGQDLRAVLDATALDGPVVLVGHSMGGMAILAFAEAFPQEFGTRVAGVVLADTAAGEMVRGALAGVVGRLHRLAVVPGRADRFREYLRAGESDFAYLLARLTNFGPKAPPSLIDYVASISGQAPLDVWGDGLAAILEMDLRHALEHVRVPALVIVGDLDRMTPPRSARALVEALPDARLVVLRGAGHVAMMERHGQFNSVVRRFLDGLGAATPGAASRPERVS